MAGDIVRAPGAGRDLLLAQKTRVPAHLPPGEHAQNLEVTFVEEVLHRSWTAIT